MTGIRLALAGGILAAVAFAAGHQAGRIGSPATTPEATSLATPRAPARAARAIAPDPARPEPPGIDLDNGGECGYGGSCLDEKYHLVPLGTG